MFDTKLSVLEVYKLGYFGNFSKSFLTAQLFSAMLPIFIMSIVVEAILKLYIIFFRNISTTASKIVATKTITTMSPTAAKFFLAIGIFIGAVATVKIATVDSPDKKVISPGIIFLCFLFSQENLAN